METNGLEHLLDLVDKGVVGVVGPVLFLLAVYEHGYQFNFCLPLAAAVRGLLAGSARGGRREHSSRIRCTWHWSRLVDSNSQLKLIPMAAPAVCMWLVRGFSRRVEKKCGIGRKRRPRRRLNPR